MKVIPKITNNMYLRFGQIPENERSGIYKGDQGKIGEEIGVSCYRGVVIDDEYWVDFGVLQELFPDCQTIVCDTIQGSMNNHIMTYTECPIGWSTMVKRGTFKFMIIEIPKND